jgi:hypothetical protein
MHLSKSVPDDRRCGGRREGHVAAERAVAMTNPITSRSSRRFRASPEDDFYLRNEHGSVRLSPESAAEFIRTRFSAEQK